MAQARRASPGHIPLPLPSFLSVACSSLLLTVGPNCTSLLDSNWGLGRWLIGAIGLPFQLLIIKASVVAGGGVVCTCWGGAGTDGLPLLAACEQVLHVPQSRRSQDRCKSASQSVSHPTHPSSASPPATAPHPTSHHY